MSYHHALVATLRRILQMIKPSASNGYAVVHSTWL